MTNRRVVVDYLNFSSILYLIRNEKSSDVTALYKPASYIMEYILTLLCKVIGIRYGYDRMMFSELSRDPTVDVINNLDMVVGNISELYNGRWFSKNDCYYKSSFERWLYNDLYRSIAVIEYVKEWNSSVDAVYVSSSLEKSLLAESSEYFCMSRNSFDIYYYNAFGLIDDDNYTRKRVQVRVKLLGEWGNSILKLLYILLYAPLRQKLTNCKANVLLFLHDFDRKWLGLDDMVKHLNLQCMFILSDGGCISDNNRDFKLNYMPIGKVISYYTHMVRGIYKFFWLLTISPNWNLFVHMLYEWRDSFFLELLYKECGVKIVLSTYESNIAQNAVSIASGNNNMASFSGQWSLGEYPSKYCISWHKFSDRYFIWGGWHHDLMRASNDESSGYVVSGYIGDNYIQLMTDKAKVFGEHHLGKVITVYDTGATDDTSHNKKSIIDYVQSVLTVANEFNALVVIKAKRKGSPNYTELLNLYNRARLVVEYEKGSLVAALASDVVVGISSSTPTSIAACHGKQSIMYDPNGLVWKQWELDGHYLPMVHTLDDLQMVLRRLLSNKKPQKTINTERIDPFADGKSQYRMANYIECVFDNLYLGKKEALLYADTEYKREWGKDKVYLH